MIDNVNRRLDNSDLCKVLTETVHADRAFRTHEKILLPVKSTWIATGNNIQLGGDMPRRCYWVRLDAKMSQPFLRTGFQIENLKTFVSDHRGELLGALLTLARAWYAAGSPKPFITPLGSYEAWSVTVGGILQHANIPGFLGNADKLYDEADGESLQWEGFLHVLKTDFYEDPFTVNDVATALQEKTWNGSIGKLEPTKRSLTLKAALPDFLAEVVDRDGFFRRRAGKCFAERAGRRFGESQVHLKRGEIVHHAQQWKVMPDTESNNARGS